jgi:hypothetical protein
MEAARRHGLLVGKGGTYGNCIRISPPLSIAKSDVELKECVDGTGSQLRSAVRGNVVVGKALLETDELIFGAGSGW